MVWLIAGGLIVLILAPLGYMAWVSRWEQKETLGDRYFARTRAERLALKEKVRARGRTVVPIARVLAAFLPMMLLVVALLITASGSNGRASHRLLPLFT